MAALGGAAKPAAQAAALATAPRAALGPAEYVKLILVLVLQLLESVVATFDTEGQKGSRRGVFCTTTMV